MSALVGQAVSPALALLLCSLALLPAQTVEPWNNRAYRADFDQFITDGKYADAEAAARKAIAKAELETGPESIDSALALDMLTEVHHFYGDRIREPAAEENALRAIAIKEKVLGANHYELAVSLRLMGNLAARQGRLRTRAQVL